ncbi:glycosyltransferase involved in cell wall biosynthesis [Dysgonomonas sp. PH5-45]|uniref:glycosyltransferase family 2 protein n=1 Tax=unclassified Dysgonomonas TaxID=2630389 RepID=UPI0024734D9B|nr:MULTISPECIES: glycosyltransferase family 2 protein [unclassified Dysgonomonas]MDH6353915.1 glycosyltransferase involved in cell wall biosynthesis [Dysgonomonas sp. PH5-45]MDH6386817.1 glycosyltransferase involved in cell wall biosynthesis [Dysgonomonas sp. PH5-37]
MQSPLVSVLIPCYNVELYVEKSINSILNQTYTNLELVVIDDCSTDGTNAILQSLARKDSRIKLYKNEPNLKLIKTLNKGIGLCSGKYIARMDADDISLPERIAKEVTFLEENPDYDIVSSMFYTFRKDRRKHNLYINPCKYEELQAFLLFKSGICHPAVMIRKTLFTEQGLKFEEEYLHVEDYGLWSKALYVTKLANIPEPLLLYRVHESQISTLNAWTQLENKKKVFKIHCAHLGLPDTDDYLDIYASVAEANPKYSSFTFLSECESFMLNLQEKNIETPYCSQDYLQDMLSLHWLRLCANSRLGLKVLKRCFSSPLYLKQNYTRQDYLILFIKCLFKLEYKKSVIYRIIFR